MPRYPDSKDINASINVADVEAMLAKAKTDRDRFLIAVLWLTGSRVSEVCRRLQAKDITNNLEDDFFTIRLFTAKQGNIKRFHSTHRELEINKQSPFARIVYSFVQGKEPETVLIPISTRRAQTIIDQCSDKTVCPNLFRHNRLTRLAHEGATLDELKSWKGAADVRSVSPYMQAKPTGRRLVIT